MGYISIKWLGFYAYQLLESNAAKGWDWSSVNSAESLVYTCGMLLGLLLPEIMVLFLPIQWALHQHGGRRLGLLVLAFAAEFAIGWYATNQQLSLWLGVKTLLSIGALLLLYRKISGCKVLTVTILAKRWLRRASDALVWEWGRPPHPAHSRL